MTELNKKLFKNVTVLIGFVIFLAVILPIMTDTLSLWIYVSMVALSIILCGVFAYGTIKYCVLVKEEANPKQN